MLLQRLHYTRERPVLSFPLLNCNGFLKNDNSWKKKTSCMLSAILRLYPFNLPFHTVNTEIIVSCSDVGRTCRCLIAFKVQCVHLHLDPLHSGSNYRGFVCMHIMDCLKYRSLRNAKVSKAVYERSWTRGRRSSRQDSQNSKQHHFEDQFLVFHETAPGDSESAQHTEGKWSNIHF